MEIEGIFTINWRGELLKSEIKKFNVFFTEVKLITPKLCQEVIESIKKNDSPTQFIHYLWVYTIFVPLIIEVLNSDENKIEFRLKSMKPKK